MTEGVQSGSAEPVEPTGDQIVALARALEVAAPKGTRLAKVFRSAADGDIELLFPKVGNQPRLVLRPAKNEQVIGEPYFALKPDFLALSRADCEQLRDAHSALVTQSTHGYRRYRIVLKPLYACEADSDPKYPVVVEGESEAPPRGKHGRWTAWTLWSDGGPFQQLVRPEDIYVRSREFERWVAEVVYRDLGLPAPIPVELHKDAAKLNEVRNDFPQLYHMCDVASRFWINKYVHREDPDSHPTSEEIVEWLTRIPGKVFSPSAAEEAARLIKPVWAK